MISEQTENLVYDRNLTNFYRHAQDYIQKSMTSDKFVVLIHSSGQDRTAMANG